MNENNIMNVLKSKDVTAGETASTILVRLAVTREHKDELVSTPFRRVIIYCRRRSVGLKRAGVRPRRSLYAFVNVAAEWH